MLYSLEKNIILNLADKDCRQIIIDCKKTLLKDKTTERDISIQTLHI